MKRIYCIFDLVAQSFIGQLVVDRADAPVIRMFHDVCANEQSQVGQHPADYELRYCGQVADDGTILPLTPPQVVATGAAWLAAKVASSQDVPSIAR